MMSVEDIVVEEVDLTVDVSSAGKVDPARILLIEQKVFKHNNSIMFALLNVQKAWDFGLTGT